jgi:hypothetical protein
MITSTGRLKRLESLPREKAIKAFMGCVIEEAFVEESFPVWRKFLDEMSLQVEPGGELTLPDPSVKGLVTIRRPLSWDE